LTGFLPPFVRHLAPVVFDFNLDGSDGSVQKAATISDCSTKQIYMTSSWREREKYLGRFFCVLRKLKISTFELPTRAQRAAKVMKGSEELPRNMTPKAKRDVEEAPKLMSQEMFLIKGKERQKAEEKCCAICHKFMANAGVKAIFDTFRLSPAISAVDQRHCRVETSATSIIKHPSSLLRVCRFQFIEFLNFQLNFLIVSTLHVNIGSEEKL
jgi:hypothetical protein